MSTTSTGPIALPSLGRERPGRPRRQGAAAREVRERRKLSGFLLSLKEIAQGGLDQFRHRSPLTRRLAPELSHDRFIDVERGLHMDFHIGWMAVCPELRVSHGSAGLAHFICRRVKRRIRFPQLNRHGSRWKLAFSSIGAALLAGARPPDVEVELSGRRGRRLGHVYDQGCARRRWLLRDHRDFRRGEWRRDYGPAAARNLDPGQ